MAALMPLVFFCSYNDDPVRWESAAEVPVTNERFNLKEQFDDLFDYTDTMRIVDPDSTKLGDTLLYKKTSHDTIDFEQSENKIDTQTYHAELGPFPLTGTTSIKDTLALPQSAGNFSATLPVKIDKVYEVTFYDTSVNILKLKIDNLSSSILSNVSVGIAGVATQTIPSIAANASVFVNLDVSGKSIAQTVPFVFSGNSLTAGPKQLGLSFSLDGLLLSKCKIDDHLSNFNLTFFGTYDITDTIKMDFIDIEAGNFEYRVTNGTGINITARVEHQHLWQQWYCEGNNVENLNDVQKFNASDSTNYAGFITDNEEGNLIQSQKVKTFRHRTINGTRLFTLWNPLTKETYTVIKYVITSNSPKGDTLSISSTDFFDFTVYVVNFKFKEFLGTVMEAYEKEGDTQKVAITLPKPWNKSMKDSLRGNLVFSEVNGNVHVETKMPAGSYFDTMNVSFAVSVQDKKYIKDSTSTKYCNVKNGAKYDRTIDITKVTNQFPDTVLITTIVRVPVGTRLRVRNNLSAHNFTEYEKYIGKMTVNIIMDYDLVPKLEWSVLKEANLDLGGDKFPVLKPLRYIRKMENRRVKMNFEIRNNSNLNMYLYALIAPKKLIDTLDSLSTNEFVKLISVKDSAEKRGFINFLGTEGVLIPHRLATVPSVSEVTLNNSQLETVLASDTCSWRWLAKLVKGNGSDALTDTDYIDIQSKLRTDGTLSTDSLLIW